MMTDRDHDQPSLFLRPAPARPAPRAPSLARAIFDEYRAAWEHARGRPLALPSWGETLAQAKRLGALIPDPELRAAFLAAFLGDPSPFLLRRDHALRYALTTSAFPRYRADAERACAERRRYAPQAPAPGRAPSARRFGRPWTVEATDRAGTVVLAFVLWAASEETAGRLARAWWLRRAPQAHAVAVRPRALG